MGRLTVAIDGPAGAGKSTVARIIAEKLNILYLDTGAMFRTVAYAVCSSGIDPEACEGVIEILDSLCIDVKYVDSNQRMYLNGKDVTDGIRTPRVSSAASKIAVIPEVRLKLVKMQRHIAEHYSLVIDGRDIGTYVLPDADVKFFLVADLKERGRRRWNEIINMGQTQSLESVIEDIKLRDLNDENRDFAPLVKALDAITIDTTDKTIEQVVLEMCGYIENKAGCSC